MLPFDLRFILYIGAYATYTLLITQWRTQFRIDMNKKEQNANKIAVESMLNFENIWYNNAVEVRVIIYMCGKSAH